MAMKSLLLSSVLLASLATPSAAATLVIHVLDNGVLVGSAVSTTGTIADRIVSDPAFDIIDISASGSPFLPGGDLSSVTLDVTSAAISTTHTLDVQVFQTGISVPAGRTEQSTLTVNNLIGAPGPSTLNTFANGTTSSLGTLLVGHTFPLGTSIGTFGPISTSVGAITADAHQYVIGFSHPDQSANDTIQLTTGIPETSTWVMFTIGFAAMGAAFRYRKRSTRFLEV